MGLSLKFPKAIILISLMIIGLPVLEVNLKTTRAESAFNDNFDDGTADGWTPQVGSWSVINGEYFVSVGIVENGITTVNGLNFKDCTIETKLRFTDDVGFRAGLVFRYIEKDTYYSLEVSNEYDVLCFVKYLPEYAGYGTQDHGFVGTAPTEINFANGELMLGRKPIGNVPVAKINKGVEYTLRVTITGNTFVGELIGGGINQTIVWEDKENPFMYGTVGLRARRADAYFDSFRVDNATVAPLPTPTPAPTPSPRPMPTQSLQSYSDDFSTDSGAWQYLGSAYRDQTNEYLVLTPSGNEAAGVVFFKAPIQGSFTANFRYKAGGGSHQGDGFTMFFYKQEYASIDSDNSGNHLGFNSFSIIPGYGIEFDGWQNIPWDFQQVEGEQQNPQGDPSANHIALIKDFSGNHLAYVDDLRVADNNWHQVTVEVQASSVKVFVDQGLVLQWSGVLDRTYDRFGFSGATGGVGSNWHIIDDFSLTASNLQKPSLNIELMSSASQSSFNVKISGSLTSNGKGISEAPILLSYSVTGGKSWQDLTLVYTDSDGSYSAMWLPFVTGNYLVKAIYEGEDNSLGASSEIVNFAVTQFAEENTLFSVSSNSTVTSLVFDSENSELKFTVSGPSETTGYAKTTIAKSLVLNPENIRVYLDGNLLEYEVTSDADSWLLSFTYTHSTHQVSVILPVNNGGITLLGMEYSIWVVLATVVIVIGISLLVYFKKRKH